MFLTRNDFVSLISEDVILSLVTDFEAPNMIRAQQYAIEQAKSKLNFHYDTDLIFELNSFDFDNSQAYKEGEVIIDGDGKGYTCIADATAGTALTDTNFFKLGDPRNPLLVMLLVDMTVYHFMGTADTPQTEYRKKRYEQAMLELDKIRMRKSNPKLPVKTYEEGSEDPNESSHTFSIISKPKRNNHF